MQKLFVLNVLVDYEPTITLGVFFTRKDAKKAMRKWLKKDREWVPDSFTLETHILGELTKDYKMPYSHYDERGKILYHRNRKKRSSL